MQIHHPPGWWIGRPGGGPIRRCHRVCVPIAVLMSRLRHASSVQRRAWARERMPGPPALPHSVENGVFLRRRRGPVSSGNFLRPHRRPGVRARFRSALWVSGKTLVLNRDPTPLPLVGANSPEANSPPPSRDPAPLPPVGAPTLHATPATELGESSTTRAVQAIVGENSGCVEGLCPFGLANKDECEYRRD